MTKLEKLMTNPDKVRELIMGRLKDVCNIPAILLGGYCPSEFGLENCEYNADTGCTLCCEDCWNEEVME